MKNLFIVAKILLIVLIIQLPSLFLLGVYAASLELAVIIVAPLVLVLTSLVAPILCLYRIKDVWWIKALYVITSFLISFMIIPLVSALILQLPLKLIDTLN